MKFDQEGLDTGDCIKIQGPDGLPLRCCPRWITDDAQLGVFCHIFRNFWWVLIVCPLKCIFGLIRDAVVCLTCNAYNHIAGVISTIICFGLFIVAIVLAVKYSNQISMDQAYDQVQVVKTEVEDSTVDYLMRSVGLRGAINRTNI